MHIALILMIVFPVRSQTTQTSSVSNYRIDQLINQGKYQLARNVRKADSIKLVLESIVDKESNTPSIKALLFLCEIYLKNGNYNRLFDRVNQLSLYEDALLDRQDAFQKQIYQGHVNSLFREFKKADDQYELAVKYAKEMRSYSALAEVNRYRALDAMMQKKKDRSVYFAEEALKFARRSGSKTELAKAFNCQATVYEYFGQVELSVAKNLVALQLAGSSNERWCLAKYTREIGQKQLQISNLKDAEYYFNRSIEYAREINDCRQMGLALGSLAEVYRQSKKYASAILQTEKAIDLLLEVNDQNGLGEMHSNLGKIYHDQDANAVSITHFNKALFYYESAINREKIAEVYFLVATVFRDQKRLDKAKTYLEKSLSISNSFGTISEKFQIYKELSSVYRALGNEKKSLEYLELYVAYSDNSSAIQASQKIAELSELYRSEERDRLIAIQADSLEKQVREKELSETRLENVSLRNKFQTYIIIGILVLIVAGSMIAVSRYNQAISKQKLKEAEMAQMLLRSQMNPHFIFNAMNVIQSYIYENDVENSTQFLIHFSRLMRLILENSSKEFIGIETELDILRKYLEMQKLRFEERFTFEIECADDLLEENVLIPPMITQPFVENAIEHGQLHTVQGGKISIRFWKTDSALQVEISDNGIGRKKAAERKNPDHKSMAMSITKDRLTSLNLKYKTDAFFMVSDLNIEEETGTKVLISLPYKTDFNE